MSESMTVARDYVRGLIAAGVRDVVLCPGSRSAPLAYAVAEAEAVGRLRLHVRTDERTAGFLALGLGRGDPSRPAVVVTTSGTAVANLHPAVLEAHHARVPMVVLTADRPAHLHGTWANQTTHHQARMFGKAVQYEDGSDPTMAVKVSLGLSDVAPGPVHVNLGLADPLYLQGDASTDYPPAGEPPQAPPLPSVDIAYGPRTVVVAGDRAGDVARDVAEQAGWPMFAEPSSNVLPSSVAIPAYRLLGMDDVQRAIVVGRPTLSRPVNQLLNREDVELIHLVKHRDDPGPGRSYQQLIGIPELQGHPTHEDRLWLAEWLDRGNRTNAIVDERISRLERPSGPSTARRIVETMRSGEALVVASSNPIRDVDLVAHGLPGHVLVVANRGLAGIDGTISTAMGVAIASGRRTRLLIGDLAFLHDLNALNIPPTEARPDLQIVVVNDVGGAIFSTLEYGARPDFFERVFGTPHTVDLSAAAQAHGIRIDTLGSPIQGLSVVEIRTDRSGVRRFHDDIARRVRDSVEQ